MSTSRPASSGFDQRPGRPKLLTAAIFIAVVLAAAAFAHSFRNSAKVVLDWYGDSRDPTVVARTLHGVVVAAAVTVAVLVAALANRFADKQWSGQTGVDAVAASARGDARRIS
ncbi:MAG TPA: hypothetical protein PKV27_03330, partial [Ilumatobacteraceae bacterium]|nr:hypothetical protein [Ilumatobacteraceae bacterium]